MRKKRSRLPSHANVFIILSAICPSSTYWSIYAIIRVFYSNPESCFKAEI